MSDVINELNEDTAKYTKTSNTESPRVIVRMGVATDLAVSDNMHANLLTITNAMMAKATEEMAKAANAKPPDKPKSDAWQKNLDAMTKLRIDENKRYTEFSIAAKERASIFDP